MRAPAVAALVLALESPAGAGQDLARLLAGMEAAYAGVQGYRARFVRQEVVGGVLRAREEALLKFLHPGLMYLRWTAGPPAGREILFVPGRDDNRMLVHEPGWFSRLVTVAIPPDSPRVLRESRHPVTDIGIGRLIELIQDNAGRAAAAGELTLRDGGVVTGAAGEMRRLEAVLSRQGQGRYYCHRLELGVALGSGLPVRATIYDWDDRKVADYEYLDLELNPALTAGDFDAGNPEYGFPRWRVSWR
jgi:outer membrane lipoprotein-sorting protein